MDRKKIDIELKLLCQQYFSIINQIERSDDSMQIQRLEERRVELHNNLLDVFSHNGVSYKDRWDVIRLAWEFKS